MRRQCYLIVLQEGKKHRAFARAKAYSLGSIYTHANKGHAYWMPREDWPHETRPIPTKLPAYHIPLHLAPADPAKAQRRNHRATMASFTKGRGFSQQAA